MNHPFPAQAITTITAGVAVFPVNAIFAYGGSRAPVALAVLAYGTLGALILGLGSLDRISEWSNLVAIFALQGVNRAIFENSTKFIFLDTFRGSGHVDAALASIYAHSGFASTVTFASLFSENIGLAGAALLLFALGIGLGFYLVDRGPRARTGTCDPSRSDDTRPSPTASRSRPRGRRSWGKTSRLNSFTSGF